MKKYVLALGLLVLSVLTFAQESYQYVIIPTKFPEFAEGFNPYGLSTSLQIEFKKKSIRNTFESNQVGDDYCNALTVNLAKESSMFRNKVKVELKDCRNRVVWSQEGMGESKEYNLGYAEAIADALKDLKQLPVNERAAAPTATRAFTSTPQAQTTAVQPQPISEAKSVPASTSSLYRPANLFYNYTYFIDLVEKEAGKKELVLLNGKLLGYKDLQIIGTLTPSGLDQVFTLEWTDADGNRTRGVANLSSNELKISLPGGDDLEVITLQKY